MHDPAETRTCPACGADVVADAPRQRACLPFPPVAALRCERCGNTGSELRLHGRTVVQWRWQG